MHLAAEIYTRRLHERKTHRLAASAVVCKSLPGKKKKLLETHTPRSKDKRLHKIILVCLSIKKKKKLHFTTRYVQLGDRGFRRTSFLQSVFNTSIARASGLYLFMKDIRQLVVARWVRSFSSSDSRRECTHRIVLAVEIPLQCRLPAIAPAKSLGTDGKNQWW